MKRIVTADQMKYLDENTITNHRIDSLVLMERAALSVVRNLSEFDLNNTLVVCGSGNNGGDGIAIARMLHLMGKKVTIFFAGNPDRQTYGCARQAEVAKTYGVRWINNPDYSEYTTIVDALFGVGLSRTITGKYADIINSMNASEADIVAVDIPSGLNADNGKIMGCAIRADMTVTFAYEKVGQLIRPGKNHCGRLVVEDIGIYEEKDDFEYNYFTIEKEDLKKIPTRSKDGNKGTFGKVLLIAGSLHMPGASVLCGRTIMRTGAGMLKMIIPIENKEIISTSIPEAMLAVYDSAEMAKKQIDAALAWADVVAIGPGLSSHDTAVTMVKHVLENSRLPIVIDADAINIISRDLDLLRNCSCPCILTPHVGEMARLLGKKTADVTADILNLLKGFVSEYNVQCVLKDSVTSIALPDKSVYINRTGNCGMATAGSGDVLTGIITGLLAVGTAWEHAGAIGVWIHGAAGDRYSKKFGTAHLMAGDLINELADFRIGEERGESDESI